MKRALVLATAGWLGLITGLHLWLNLDHSLFAKSGEPAERRFRVGYIPVTCHLTCPVTDFINRSTKGEGIFQPIRFSGFPELKETFLAGRMEATFILVPLAISLRESGVPIKMVYLGHRDGTALVVHDRSDIHRIEDLRGKTVAIPNRYSNQHLLLFKALRDRGLSTADVKLLEMPPPDMPAALYARAVDAITSGEPYMAQAELDGYGRVLYLTKDIWPNFISCVLAIRENVIQNDRATVQALVDGIARSGKWLETSMDNRLSAADFVAKNYYNQHPRLLRFVLSKPPDRVKYSNLRLFRKDFEEIEKLGLDSGILKGTVGFDDYADPSFVKEEAEIEPWNWVAGK
jgi:NitT/TauT family transport system substrate-binding protein